MSVKSGGPNEIGRIAKARNVWRSAQSTPPPKDVPGQGTLRKGGDVTLTSGPNLKPTVEAIRSVIEGILNWKRRMFPRHGSAGRAVAALTGGAKSGAEIDTIMKDQREEYRKADGRFIAGSVGALGRLNVAGQNKVIKSMRRDGTDAGLSATEREVRKLLIENDKHVSDFVVASGLRNADGTIWQPLKGHTAQIYNKDARKQIERRRGPLYDLALKTVTDTFRRNSVKDNPAEWLEKNYENFTDDPIRPLKQKKATDPSLAGNQLHRLITWPDELLLENHGEAYVSNKRRLLTAASAAMAFGPEGQKINAVIDRAAKDVETTALAKGEKPGKSVGRFRGLLNEVIPRQIGRMDPVTEATGERTRKALSAARQFSAAIHLAGSPVFGLINTTIGTMTAAYRLGLGNVIRKFTGSVPALFGRGKAITEARFAGSVDHGRLSDLLADMGANRNITDRIHVVGRATENMLRTLSSEAGPLAGNENAAWLHRKNLPAAMARDTRAWRDLKRMGLDDARIEKAAKAGKLSDAQVQQIKRGAVDVTQGLADAWNVGAAMTSPWGRVLYQFWPYNYLGAVNTLGHALAEAGHMNVIPMVRLLPLLFAAGYTNEQIRNFAYGRRPDEEEMGPLVKFLRRIGDAAGIADRPIGVATGGSKWGEALERVVLPVVAADAHRIITQLQAATNDLAEGDVGNAGRRMLRIPALGRVVDERLAKGGAYNPFTWRHKAPWSKEAESFYRLFAEIEKKADTQNAANRKGEAVTDKMKIGDPKLIKWYKLAKHQKSAIDRTIRAAEREKDPAKKKDLMGRVDRFLRKIGPEAAELSKQKKAG